MSKKFVVNEICSQYGFNKLIPITEDKYIYWKPCLSKLKFFQKYPEQLTPFWNKVEEMDYGVDDPVIADKYGRESGIRLLGAQDALSRNVTEHLVNSDDYCYGDVMLGYNVSHIDEIIIMRCDDKFDDYGQVIKVIPTASRQHWDTWQDLNSFLEDMILQTDLGIDF